MVELEKAGVPTVSFTAEAFARDARRSAQAFGLPALPIAVVPLPFTNQTPDEIRRAVDGCIDRVIEALTTPPTLTVETPAAGAPAESLSVDGTDALDVLDRMTRLFLERGWSDGFPLVPPTPDGVERMLRGTRRARDEVVAVLEPGFGVATVEKIAINCVMAGCLPEHLPVLIAAVQAVAEPTFFLRIAAMSTGPHAPLILVNGPLARELGINSGRGALGPGSQNRANVVIGRALRLIYMNVGQAYPGVMDMDTIGSANKFSLCLAENEDANPWSPFHVERGYDRDTSAVTVITVYAQSDVFDFFNTTPEGILNTVASAAANIAVASTGRWLEGSWADPKTKVKILDRNLLLLCPEHAAIIAKHGWSKADVRDYLYRHATLPFRVLRSNREPSTLIAGRPDLQWLTQHPDLPLPLVELPECYEIAVVGGAAGRSMYFYGAHEAITKPIERSKP
ncbi:MAG: hypothetical protein HY726_22440 [Candidatus Rokubacteria bacterium]|nr:hypothetical protein [Candidatus Rokubacteria bacterium]